MSFFNYKFAKNGKAFQRISAYKCNSDGLFFLMNQTIIPAIFLSPYSLLEYRL